MVSFGGGMKKKATTTYDVPVIKSSTPTSSPSKKSKNVTPPKSIGGGGFFRKALGTPVKNPIASTPTTPSTPPVNSPDSSSKIIKERPSVQTIDIPLQSHIPSTPDNRTMRGNTSLLDSPSLYRIDSVLSDLSGSQIRTNAGTGADPPAFILRTSSIEAASGSSGYVNSNSAKETKSVTAESIVTKVLGIVDISCVSSGLVPSSPTRTVAQSVSNTQPTRNSPLKPAYSFQPEWGVAPEDEDVTITDPKSLGSGGNSSDHSGSGNINNPINTNGSAMKRELAEIAARASAPSTLEFNHDIMASATDGEGGNKSYRRYHETFELVYTEPIAKKNKKGNAAQEITSTEKTKKIPKFMSNNSALSARGSKGLRINQWAANQWRMKKKSAKREVPRQSGLAPVITATSTPLGIVPQDEIISKNDRSSPPELVSDANASNNPLTTGATASMTTNTSTTVATPSTDASCIGNNCSTIVENIEATKGDGVDSGNDIDTTVVVLTTSGDSSVNITTLLDEFKEKKGGMTGTKSWYRFNSNADTRAKKEKKLVVFDNVIGGSKQINRTSPIKRKVSKNKSIMSKSKTSDFESPSHPAKILLKSIKSSTMGLETVTEEDCMDDNTELKVRVPGFQNEDSYLSDHDLIGSEIVEEIYSTLNKSIEQEEKEQMQVELQGNKESINEDNKQELSEQKLNEILPFTPDDAVLLPSVLAKITSDGYQECRDIDGAINVQQPKSKTWKERLGLKKGETESGNITIPEKIVKVLPKSISAKTEVPNGSVDKKKSKPQWKAAIDPVTGKTYYYHKKTRETTWAEPPDWDISPLKGTPNGNTTKGGCDGDEIDRAMQSNASPNCTITAAAAVLDIVDKPYEEKTENVDRMMSDITANEDANIDNNFQENEGDIEDDEFPSNLPDLTDSKPFDELGGDAEYPDDERKDEKSMATARTRTTTSIYSGFSSRFSTKSRISEVTQPIKNLSSSKPNIDVSHASISTKHDDLPVVEELLHRDRRQTRIPKNIPVPRLRELNVEEFTTRDRDFKTRTNRLPKLARSTGDYTGVQPTYSLTNANINGVGETDDADADKSTVSYAATDSISALSEADLSFVDRKEAYDDARRRALDRAIAQEDWDLAAKLSESMRKTLKSTNRGNRAFPSEWVQSEMDRFISENDWDAVTAYIAQVRANANEASQKQILNHLKADPRTNTVVAPSQVLQSCSAGGLTRNIQSNSSDVSGTSNPQKIFGARSQLQHRDLRSVDSHSSYSTTFDSEYTSESGDKKSEEERPPAPINRPRQQEFAC